MSTTATGLTNTRTDSRVDVQLDCSEMWSLAQQFAYARLIAPSGPGQGTLLAFANVRSRRIAATYARFYLETEDGGKPELKGRYYWMALGAFASKTVACSLEMLRVQSLPTVYMGLARGSLWLFLDLAAWHWYWSMSPGSFTLCESTRSAGNCVPQVREVLAKLPWAKEALPKINQMRGDEFVHEGFELVAQIEQMPRDHMKRSERQFAHLMAIVKHEQNKVLQPLIYEDEDFAFWIKMQRSRWVSWIAPTLEISFAAACKVDDPELKNEAPEGTVLEDYNSRMYWIARAANNFHRMMQKKTIYMEEELIKMTNWVEMNDPPPPVVPAFPL